MGHRLVGGVLVVHDDAVEVELRQVAVQQHDGNALVARVPQVIEVRHRRRRDDQALDLLVQQRPHRALLEVEALVAVGEDRLVALPVRDVADAAHGLGEVRVGDVRADEADAARAARPHAAGDDVRRVTELARGRLDPLAGLLAHVAVAAERPPGGRDRDPGAARHVGNRRPPGAALSPLVPVPPAPRAQLVQGQNATFLPSCRALGSARPRPTPGRRPARPARCTGTSRLRRPHGARRGPR